MTSIVARIKSQLTGTPIEPAEPAEYRILFVCMGNICRSPTVEGVLRRRIEQELPGRRIEVDSAGTHAYHVGEPPDARAQRAAEKRGVDLRGLRARRVGEQDFTDFDLIVAMDPLNVAAMEEICPVENRAKIRLLMEFAPGNEREDVPDPYYGGSNGFEYVLDLAEEAAAGLLAHVRQALPPD